MSGVPPELREIADAWRLELHDRQCRPACPDREACANRWVAHTPVAGWVAAVEVLRARPRDVAGARLALHDAVCMSAPCGDRAAEHARTQRVPASALRAVLDRQR